MNGALPIAREANPRRLRGTGGVAYGTRLPFTLTVRSSRLGLRSCGKAAVAATGVSNRDIAVDRAP
jgi:hypothetical protein